MGSGEAMGENQKEGSGSTESGCSRLPKDIISLRNYSISLFVSNLKPTISKVELEAMFCRSGRIVDSFILTKKSIGLGCGFAFVRFKPLEEANRAVTDNNDRGGGRLPTLCQKSFGEVVASPSALHEEAWAMKDSFGSGVRVAP
ncbi:hypothetical protein MRB53_035247 [Persea americana]|uniref:Uncharacterized protein n=1 Tax=Persea americana TaxID=3435 RepID=A0ACC2K438_PERAE|nr:hypothetical protein MRB53_035247 [Persea americana]